MCIRDSKEFPRDGPAGHDGLKPILQKTLLFSAVPPPLRASVSNGHPYSVRNTWRLYAFHAPGGKDRTGCSHDSACEQGDGRGQRGTPTSATVVAKERHDRRIPKAARAQVA